ncbi:uncharacterized protein cd34 [Mustelus asterias]
MWSLVKISKGQQVSLILCALCVIDQWSCHSSAVITTTNPPERNNSTQSDINQGDLSGVLNNSTENITQPTDETTTTYLTHTTEPASQPSHIETHFSPTINSKSNNWGFGTKSEMQSDKPYSKAGPPNVLIALLVCGLVFAAILLAVYYRMNKRSWSPQSKRLDEEPDAQDQHDSTMFSVASEDQSDAHEKPKLNGEAQENGENQIAASGAATGNGHQRKKAEEADTEL